MKKIVIFGGGSGLSQLLKGLKLFPIDLTAVVSVSDNGRSTGLLRKDFNIPAVGDITKVLLAMSDANSDVKKLMSYHKCCEIELFYYIVCYLHNLIGCGRVKCRCMLVK